MTTYDDGILKIYKVTNSAAPGETPVAALAFKTEFCFSYSEIGISKFFYAQQAGQTISAVCETYFDDTVRVNDVAEFEDGSQALVRMIQPTTNEDGIKIMKLSLERIEHSYDKIN